MIILLVTTLIIIIGIVLDHNDYDLGMFMYVAFGLFLLFEVISIPISRASYWRDVERLEVFKETIKESRKTADELERVVILKSIIEWNDVIAAAKYDNTTVLDIWIPDHIDTVKFIK